MDREQLKAAIAAQESLRGLVADEVIETTVAALRRHLATFDDSSRRRRQVTVLFADVSGFTAMSETLDAEDVTDVMNSIWDRLDEVVATHGGRIDKHIGDALMAIWGADTTREDDPEQAVRAALGFQEAMADHRVGSGIELRIRVGVNTGPVVLDTVGSRDEFTALGDTVNLASRLEHAAPIDGVLISHDTYRHMKGVFTVSVQPPLEVKGKRRPVRSYLVEAARPRVFRLGTRGVEGVETRMVGRDPELDRLRALLSETVEDGTARSVTVVGDAGVGKSRLLYEFEDWLRIQSTEVRLLKARADQQHTGDPYFVIRDLLFSRFEIAEDDPPRIALDKLTAGLRELAPLTDAREVELIATLVGIETDGAAVAAPSDASLLSEQMRVALATVVSRAAAVMPVVVLLEDIHWADPSSLEAVESLMSRCAGSPLFTLQLTRPTLFEQYTPVSRSSSSRIDLTPLGEPATRQLVEEVLQNVTNVPEAVTDELSTLAAGNPFFLEELVKVMIDTDTIVVNDDEWSLDLDRLDRTRPPLTITGVLQARIDHLSPSERAVLERAAVVGRTFWDDAVASASATDGAQPLLGDVSSVLASLEAKELVFRQPSSSFLDTRQYIFKHALLHDVAYEQVLKSDRSRLHRAAADWHIQRGDSSALSATIAGHYDAAGDEAEAAAWHARAGRHAARHFAPQEAVGHLESARRAPRLESETRWWVLEELSEVLEMLARYGEGLEVAEEMLTLATELNDPGRQAMALLERSRHLTRLGRLGDALGTCERAEALLALIPADPVHHMRVHTERGWLLLRLGRTSEAIEAGSTALSLANERTETRELRGAHSQLGAAQHAIGNMGEAEHHLQEALRLDREHHSQRNEAADLINLGVLASSRSEHPLAIGRYEAALRITREIGDLDQEALALNNLGGERISQHEYGAASAQLTESLRLFEAANAAEHTSETHCLLARARLGLGENEGALEAARLALEMAEHSGSPDHLGNAWLTLAAIARAANRTKAVDDAPEQEALACLERGVTILTDAGLEIELAGSLRQLAGINEDGGDPAWTTVLRRLEPEVPSRPG